MVKEFTAKDILQGIKDREIEIIEFIYNNFYNQIKVFITKNKGTEKDVRNIYQDALLVIYRKQQKEIQTLSCSFDTYLYSVCRLLWLKQFEQKQQRQIKVKDTGIFIELDTSYIEIFELNKKHELYQRHFNKLTFNCRKVLELFFTGIPLKEIARILNFKNEESARKRKHQCKEKLVSIIKSDPEFKY